MGKITMKAFFFAVSITSIYVFAYAVEGIV